MQRKLKVSSDGESQIFIIPKMIEDVKNLELILGMPMSHRLGTKFSKFLPLFARVCRTEQEVKEDMGKTITTGQFRETLLDCFEKAMRGELTNDQIKGIIGISNQINANLAAEIRLRQFELKAGKTVSDLGDIQLGTHDSTGIPSTIVRAKKIKKTKT